MGEDTGKIDDDPIISDPMHDITLQTNSSHLKSNQTA